MNADRIRQLLAAVQRGESSVDDAVSQLADLPFVENAYARVDTHRSLRLGRPEVIFGLGKRPEQVVGIAGLLLGRGQSVLVTRVEPEAQVALVEAYPHAVVHEMARCVTVRPEGVAPPAGPGHGHILVVTAGTSDIPVAEEARVTAEAFGDHVEVLYDAGVAGIHRLLEARERLMAARVVVVVAGMEGALASVVGGLIAKPIVAVPTSVGYGASFGGLAALLAMLNSCAAGVTVVNIDNGFGAAYAASLINRLGAADDGAPASSPDGSTHDRSSPAQG